MIERVTDLVKTLITNEKDIDLAVDMTAGNGNDSLFILDEIKANRVVAFDIQNDAEKATRKLLGERDNFLFILDSHANIDKYIKEKIDLAVYNLGYLPKGDKTITTKYESTLESLKKLLQLLGKNAKVYMTIYPGHDQGRIEASKIEDFIARLPNNKYAIMKISYPNKGTIAPYIVIIEKKF